MENDKEKEQKQSHFTKVKETLKKYLKVEVELQADGILIKDYAKLSMGDRLQVLAFLQQNRTLVNGMKGTGLLGFPKVA